jgi:RNA polymerase sigma-70 factor (ECF subfamily)
MGSLHSERDQVATPAQEAQWVLRAQCDDREALELLLRSIQPALNRYIRGLIGSSHSDDVMQEVLVTVYRKLRSLHSPELFRPWTYRVASRIAFRHLKKSKVCREQSDGSVLIEEMPASDRSPPSERLQELLSLNGISPASRAVLALHFQEELSLPEVAAILEIPLGTVKSRLAYGLSAIRKQLQVEKVTND